MTDTATTTATTTTTATDTRSLTARATIDIAIGTHVTGVDFDSIVVSLERYTGKHFRAFTTDSEALSGKSIVAAIADLMNAEAGKKLSKAKNDYSYPDIAWNETANAKVDTAIITLDDDEQTQLDALAVSVKTLIQTDAVLGADKRANALELGKELSAAKTLLSRTNDAGERVNVASKTWGAWQAVNLPVSATFRGKNAVAEHIEAATLPAEMVALMPVTKLSAKSMTLHAGACRTKAAERAVDDVLTALDSDESALVDVLRANRDNLMDVSMKKSLAEVGALLSARLVHYADDYVATVADFSAVPMVTKNGVATAEVDTKLLAAKEELEMIVAGAAGYPFAESKMNKAIMKALTASLKPVATPRDAADADADKYEDGESDVAMGFATFTVAEAALHLARIAVTRDDWDEVLGEALSVAKTLLEDAARAEQDADEKAA